MKSPFGETFSSPLTAKPTRLFLTNSYVVSNKNMNKQDKKKPSTKNDACDSCHARKIRCNKHKPQCYECLRRNISCNYGTRLKRGPKTPAAKDQIHNVQKSSPHIEAILFELELNQKIAEFWRILHGKIGEGVRPPPKFDPATEEFIRAPATALELMEEFNSTHRLIYTMHNFAPSTEIAVKIWQIITEVNAADIFSIIGTFKTSQIVSILEYLVVFQLSTQICSSDHTAAYIANITQYFINTVVFTRGGTSDSLTPELTLQLLPTITLITRYFKLARNKDVTASYYSLIQDLYEQNKSSPLFTEQVEARMLFRKMFLGTEESAEKCLTRVEELDKKGIMTPNLYFHFNNHLAFYMLQNKGQLSEAHKAVQKAEYFIKWHFDTIPQDKRQATEDYFTTSLNCVHLEILLRLGNIESALQRVGQMCNAYARLPTAFKSLCSSKFKFLLKSAPSRGKFLALDYLSLVINPAPLSYQVLLSTPTQPAVQQQSFGAQLGTTEEIHEQVEGTKCSDSSSQDYLLAFTLTSNDESLVETAFSPYDPFAENGIELEPIHFTEYYSA